ncbi:RagB/SusD family nutrient uptake outer membrane protein [Sinomicrobium weinanense]|uniref:RagB/SusD family nutrient uptake outer membrane protein n=1 Tax=Sinomicrobium weinanense TaxID=2842200 RepID=A0A926JQV6_9FLAO|nr:RagB/SusD family nutrient uptake outer membrane protein [Sinomicrobium weinanense]MBC9795825.1 RagB/SusD family nutrient uptake outer membrane protein [Sinomicrobium weinanense]MBU3121869.1 RagB/SusD family nutrient uptake outer membrane protein [Sinomicrobium weinanense]
MKILKYKYIGVMSLLFMGLSSCELARDLDDFEPNYTLPADEAIVDEASAELALAGVYSGFRQRSSGSGNPEIYLIPSLMSGVLTNNALFNTGAEALGYVSNNPIPIGANAGLGAYSRMYDIVNRCNWLIEKISPLPEDVFSTQGRKAEILAETKAVRATANFYLLRLFGQFYDINSKYGISLRSEPARSDEALPRNTVAEVYDAIIADLDEAITGAPDLRAKYYTNKTYARGLKAKVMLYKGDYPAAVALAGEIIEGSGPDFGLAPDYTAIFTDHSTPALFDSPEILFASKGEPQASLGIGNFTGFWASVTPAYTAFGEQSVTIGSQNIIYDGTRISSTTFDTGDIYGFDTYKGNASENGDLYEMIYHLRMAEVYLIYAEAVARANNSVTTEALAALNVVRIRGGATTTGGDGFETYPSSITLEQFLEAVRIEKYVELGVETGEEWFDLVRYHFVDGFDVTTVKPSATDPDKYILPIDGTTIEAGGNVVEQNPGY